MAIVLTGVTNENEFFTHHYISAILENDLKGLFEKWSEQDEEQKPPYVLLRRLRKDYFVMRNQWEKGKASNELLKLQRPFIKTILEALDYEYNPDVKELDSGALIPILSEIKRPNGAPELWILEALDKAKEGEDPLSLSPCECQFSKKNEFNKELLQSTFEEVISIQIFGRAEPPRWVILISDQQLLLMDRSKWDAKRLLRFDINEILDRREESTLKAMAALVHRDSVCPAEGLSLLDTLDENSHKHAHAVSEDLKYALREAIEILGNEAVYYLREVRKEKVYGVDLAKQLTLECLRYMYRLLFLFYIEARPELGYVPIKSDAYRTGYSLETLRDLEMVKLTTAESKNGFFIHESMELLFKLVYEGFPKAQTYEEQLSMLGESERYSFTIPPLRSHLFDPSRMEILNKCKFRNEPMQKIIRLMSLSKPSTGRSSRRGRVSYAQLGINQLGAVYEALLCYQGFFAETDLYEVKKAKEIYDPLKMAYFVKKEDLGKYDEDEKVYIDNKMVKHEKGIFIYRLAGRDRQKSASYYTPEVLTKCLVKYALKELLKDKSADDILELKICEPAMGSAAFLNEAVNQLSEVYLQRKQKELDQNIPLENYNREKQKVKTYLTDNNVFGIDLNPVAVELGEVSLWLNTIHEGGFVPWFGMQLICGNSLIGARRQVFKTTQLKRGFKESWLKSVPERGMPGDKRSKDAVYHFLVPDEGMANYQDKVIKNLAEKEIKAINEWRKEFCKPFTEREIKQLLTLSEAIDNLWAKHTEDQRRVRKMTTDYIEVWGQPKSKDAHKPTSTHWKDKQYEREILTKGFRHSSAYRRLKLVMDYWCALWFWPIQKADLMPSRNQFLHDLSLILQGSIIEDDDPMKKQLHFDFLPESISEKELQQALKFVDEYGFVDIDKLCEQNKRLGLVEEMNERYQYHHWELEYADLFADSGGFDLFIGNPPWIKVQWNEGGVMGDYEPMCILRKFSASKLATLRKDSMEKYKFFEEYLSAFEDREATQNFINAAHNYPLLKGTQNNLFKCFLPQAWMFSNERSVSGFLHPEGVYDDPKGGLLRKEIYKRLRYHFQFQNVKFLFPEILHWVKYSINIYNQIPSGQFESISNLFIPSTIDDCYDHSGYQEVGGIKNDNNEWNLSGHPDRIIIVDEDSLVLFSKLYDKGATPPLEARLPTLHSTRLLEVLRRFANIPKRISNFDSDYFTTEMWHETGAQKDGTIRRETRFPNSMKDWILSGPHFHVGLPFYKTPQKKCTQHHHYSSLDLTEISEYYLPRTNYVPACSEIEYKSRTPKVVWGKRKPVSEFFRLAFRGMLSQSGERTLVSSIIPKFSAHINGVQTTAFRSNRMLIYAFTFSISIVADFFIKTTGRSNLHFTWNSLPVFQLSDKCYCRSLSLNCLTNHFADLWQDCWKDTFNEDCWTKNDTRLNNNYFKKLSKKWQQNCALRTHFERRQALVEIDVLIAMALGMTLEELKTIFRVQFPVLYQFEQDTWYDMKGRIVFTSNVQGLKGVGFSRTEWDEIKDMKTGTVEREIEDDTMPGGAVKRTIVYHVPFDRCDREKDYEIAWKEFERRFKEEGE